MAGSHIQKRRSPRIFFADGAVLSIDVLLNDGTAPLTGDVLNLSTGGMQFSYNRKAPQHIVEGDKLIISDLAELTDLVGSTMEVRWVLNSAIFNHIAVGCKFIGLTKRQKNLLQQFVNIHIHNSNDNL